MTLKELFEKLEEAGVPRDRYYLNGLYGSLSDDSKPAMRMFDGNKYEVYTNERGDKIVKRIFYSENDVCDYMYQLIKDEWDFERILMLKDLDEMNVQERLEISGMSKEFEVARIENKNRAKKILKWLKVNEEDIKSLLG